MFVTGVFIVCAHCSQELFYQRGTSLAQCLIMVVICHFKMVGNSDKQLDSKTLKRDSKNQLTKLVYTNAHYLFCTQCCQVTNLRGYRPSKPIIVVQQMILYILRN